MIEIIIIYRFVAGKINGSSEIVHCPAPSHLITLFYLILNEGAATSYYETNSIN